jgi:hypothetical protein
MKPQYFIKALLFNPTNISKVATALEVEGSLSLSLSPSLSLIISLSLSHSLSHYLSLIISLTLSLIISSRMVQSLAKSCSPLNLTSLTSSSSSKTMKSVVWIGLILIGISILLWFHFVLIYLGSMEYVSFVCFNSHD